MKIRTQIVVILAIALLSLFPIHAAIAQPQLILAQESPAPSGLSASFLEKLQRLRDDRQLQDLVEEDLEKSIVIRGQIQQEVDRAFSHTTALLNVLIAVLTFLPVLSAVAIWFIRRSVINQIISGTKQQIKEEVEQQLEIEITTELKQRTELFKQEIEQLKAEFTDQLSQLKSLFLDAQKEKDKIIQELSQITPSPIRESASPETQQKIQALTQQLERLKSIHTPLSFTADDYIEQGKALYFAGRYEEATALHEKALQMEADNPKAWFSRGAALVKLQRFEEAIAAYDQVIQLKPEFSEAWFGKGTALAKMQRIEEAIAAYEKVTLLKPDFYLARFGKARCHIMQGDLEAALDDLRRAIELNPEKVKEVLKTDAVFEPLRSQEWLKSILDS